MAWVTSYQNPPMADRRPGSVSPRAGEKAYWDSFAASFTNLLRIRTHSSSCGLNAATTSAWMFEGVGSSWLYSIT